MKINYLINDLKQNNLYVKFNLFNDSYLFYLIVLYSWNIMNKHQLELENKIGLFDVIAQNLKL